jgi:uncharacterized damage-inducible protein DinB
MGGMVRVERREARIRDQRILFTPYRRCRRPSREWARRVRRGEDRSMPWTSPTLTPGEGPLAGDERPMLEAYLDWQRANLLNICAGLTGVQLATRPLPPSRLCLLGIVRHMAKVERIWFRQRVGREDVAALHGGAGHPDDFEAVDAARADVEVQALQQEWHAAATAVASISLTDTFAVGEETWSLRMVFLHMIGEYARHNGHADLLREQIDGATGR